MSGWYALQCEIPDDRKLMLFSSLLDRGCNAVVARAAVYDGRWDAVPALADEIKALTCTACGSKPYRAQGRLHLGCGGYCLNASFAALKEEAHETALKERLRAARKQSTQDEHESPLLGMFGEVEGKWE